MDGGPTSIRDTAELTSIQGQARAVHLKSVLTAAAITGLLLAA
jgi:hypothetical protein